MDAQARASLRTNVIPFDGYTGALQKLFRVSVRYLHRSSFGLLARLDAHSDGFRCLLYSFEVPMWTASHPTSERGVCRGGWLQKVVMEGVVVAQLFSVSKSWRSPTNRWQVGRPRESGNGP